MPREGKCRSNTHFGMIQFKTSWDKESSQDLIGHNLTNRLTVRQKIFCVESTIMNYFFSINFFKIPNPFTYLCPSIRDLHKSGQFTFGATAAMASLSTWRFFSAGLKDFFKTALAKWHGGVIKVISIFAKFELLEIESSR